MDRKEKEKEAEKEKEGPASPSSSTSPAAASPSSPKNSDRSIFRRKDYEMAVENMRVRGNFWKQRDGEE